MNPYRLLEKGKYKKALQIYRYLLDKYPNDECLLDGYPFACLCNGLYEEALQGFRYSNALAKKKPFGEKQPYLLDIGVMQWLLGQREEAIQTFRAGVDGILDGTIEFADLAGGALQGMFLWFAGICGPDAEARAHAIYFMEELAKKDKIEYWPGPLTQYAIGSISKETLLRNAFGCRSLLIANLRSNVDVYVAFNLARIKFYTGIKCKDGGDDNGFRYWLRECLRYKRPNPMYEWYLAKTELERLSH